MKIVLVYEISKVVVVSDDYFEANKVDPEIPKMKEALSKLGWDVQEREE